jgi:hypothetical protein
MRDSKACQQRQEAGKMEKGDGRQGIWKGGSKHERCEEEKMGKRAPLLWRAA